MIWSYLHEAEKLLLIKITQDWTHPIGDVFFSYITQLHKQMLFIYVIIPFFLYWLVVEKFRVIKVLIAAGMALALADAFSYRVIKGFVQRPRPFMELEFKDKIRTLGTAQGPSFPSNHAANCFAMASILAWFYRPQRRYFYFLATLVAYSRLYLGVHYPTDVLAGVCIGLGTGFFIRTFLLNRLLFFSGDVVSK